MARPTNLLRTCNEITDLISEALDKAEELCQELPQDLKIRGFNGELISSIKTVLRKLAFVRKYDGIRNVPVVVIDPETGNMKRASRDLVVRLLNRNEDFDIETLEEMI